MNILRDFNKILAIFMPVPIIVLDLLFNKYSWCDPIRCVLLGMQITASINFFLIKLKECESKEE